jgi:RimJ/RimL family protein N-acetyltransferase
MLQQLARSDYEKVRPLFAGLEYNLVVPAVLGGTNPGRVYVDDVCRPRSAFLCSAEGCYLGGDPENDAFSHALSKLIAERIFEGDTVRPGEDQIDIRFQAGSWEDKLALILKDKPPFIESRRHYVCRALQTRWHERIPDGFSVHRIDEALLQRPGIRHPDSALNHYAINKIKGNWGSIDEFLERGVGFCTLSGEEAVCWCIADCASGDACEVGIRTHPNYRRRGLASLTVAATVGHCLTHGFTSVGWHCWEGNAASIGVAEKVGFELEREYVSYVRLFDEVEHLATIGLVHFTAGRYRPAVEWFGRASEVGDAPNWAYHTEARAWAVLGECRAAFRCLGQAIDRGWEWSDLTMNCTEFADLHTKQEWKDVLARLEEKIYRDPR